MRGLTFELSGGRRCDDWPARLMIPSTASRARRHAVGSPLERGVRPRCYLAKGSVHHCSSQGIPSRSPSILTPGQFAKKYLASRQERICEQCWRPSHRKPASGVVGIGVGSVGLAGTCAVGACAADAGFAASDASFDFRWVFNSSTVGRWIGLSDEQGVLWKVTVPFTTHLWTGDAA